MFQGYVLAQIICYGSNSYDCKPKVIDTQIYASRSECEWQLQTKSAYYSDLQCVGVERTK